jgi:hypothetical protein
MDKERKIQWFYIISILALFFLAIVASLFGERKMVHVKLYVKDRSTGELVLQKALIPATSSVNEKVYWILKELISGPVKSEYERILDPNIEIEKVIVEDRTVYVSFDWRLIDSLHGNPRPILDAIVKTVLMNVRELDHVKILVEGIEPVSTFCDVQSGRHSYEKKC